MRVLFLVDAGKDSGIYTYSRMLADKLKERGIHVDFDKPKHLVYDIIHIQNAFPKNVLKSINAVGTPLVISTHMTPNELDGLVPDFVKRLSKSYLYSIYMLCDKIICTNQQIKDAIDKVLNFKDKTVFLTNMIDTSFFRKDQGLGEKFRKKFKVNGKMILCVASLQKRKGIFEFIEVAEQLPEYTFVWSGRIPSIPTLNDKKEINALHKSPPKNVVFTGYIGGKSLVGAYSAADLFFLPSYAETFGLVIVEAAATRIPVIARDLPVYGLFNDFLIKFKDNQDAARKIRKLFKDRKRYDKYAKKAFVGAQRFDVENHVNELLKIYIDTLRQRRRFLSQLNSLSKKFEDRALIRTKEKITRQIDKLKEMLELKI